ncbi:MAG: hypothetical protein WCI73_01045 [Phycisphaerae bacterium]
MSQVDAVGPVEDIDTRLPEEHDKGALEAVCQRLAGVVRVSIMNPEALMDHIAGRPPGECRPVSE